MDGSDQPLLPAYMTMGQAGMADMATMGMAFPPNSAPMIGGPGKYDYITMGGMFTILKVRPQLASYADPGWYETPPGTRATSAVDEALRRDGIDPTKNPGIEPAGIESPTGLRQYRGDRRPSLYEFTAPAVAPATLAGVDPAVVSASNDSTTPAMAQQKSGDAGNAAQHPMEMNTPAATSQPTEGKQLWKCVMHPEVISDKPGKCPKCGMKLVPKK